MMMSQEIFTHGANFVYMQTVSILDEIVFVKISLVI